MKTTLFRFPYAILWTENGQNHIEYAETEEEARRLLRRAGHWRHTVVFLAKLVDERTVG